MPLRPRLAMAQEATQADQEYLLSQFTLPVDFLVYSGAPAKGEVQSPGQNIWPNTNRSPSSGLCHGTRLMCGQPAGMFRVVNSIIGDNLLPGHWKHFAHHSACKVAEIQLPPGPVSVISSDLLFRFRSSRPKPGNKCSDPLAVGCPAFESGISRSP